MKAVTRATRKIMLSIQQARWMALFCHIIITAMVLSAVMARVPVDVFWAS
ncbi:hypothetical protein JKP88DRAFT_282966 [Tribonema minus]|uniref:Uncharacterized protein n=1 Tax=Tribonema minus TaxID=303371 RepID=A0A835YM58_9STRA|nr:hypothetical protein JKP88DRAFT_282966 [Tribonema minus]